MPNAREWTFGSHRAVLEEPDVIRVSFEGPTTLEDARASLEIYREVCGQRPRFLLADITRSSMDAPTRKFLGNEIRPEWFSGVVYVGASLLLRTISNALTFLVLFNARSQYETAFAPTEAEARAIIEGWRKQQQTAARAR